MVGSGTFSSRIIPYLLAAIITAESSFRNHIVSLAAPYRRVRVSELPGEAGPGLSV